MTSIDLIRKAVNYQTSKDLHDLAMKYSENNHLQNLSCLYLYESNRLGNKSLSSAAKDDVPDYRHYTGYKGKIRYWREKAKLKEEAKNLKQAAPKVVKLQRIKKTNKDLHCILKDQLIESDYDSDRDLDEMVIRNQIEKLAERQLEEKLLDIPKIPFNQPM